MGELTHEQKRQKAEAKIRELLARLDASATAAARAAMRRVEETLEPEVVVGPDKGPAVVADSGSDQRTVRMSFGVPESVREQIRAQPGGSDSDKVRRLVLAALEHRTSSEAAGWDGAAAELREASATIDTFAPPTRGPEEPPSPTRWLSGWLRRYADRFAHHARVLRGESGEPLEPG